MIASDVSSSRRLVQVICAIVWCLLAGGPIFGFAAFKPILASEGVYEKLCDVTPKESSSLTSLVTLSVNAFSDFAGVKNDESLTKCSAQDLKLNLIFTIAAMLTNVSALVIGSFLDRFGPKFCGLVGAAFLYFACFVFIYGKTLYSPYFDPYLIGYASLALGGPFAYISSFQFSNAFPKKGGTILAIITGAFDASSAVFLVYKGIYFNSKGNFGISKFFTIYLIVPTFITIAELFLMPIESYKAEISLPATPQKPSTTERALEETPLLGQSSSLETIQRRDSIGEAIKRPYEEGIVLGHEEQSGGVFGILHGYSARYQMNTPWFYLTCVFSTVQMLRINYFVATINSQYTYIFNSAEEAAKLNRLFDFMLPLGGVVSIPAVGYFLESFSEVQVFIGSISISMIMGIFGLYKNYTLAILNVLFFVVYRPLFYSSISDFCAKVFGFDTFGTVYGAIFCISGLVNYTQSFLDELTHKTFKMNPLPVNVTLLFSTLAIGIPTVIYVKTQAKILNEKKKQNDNAVEH